MHQSVVLVLILVCITSTAVLAKKKAGVDDYDYSDYDYDSKPNQKIRERSGGSNKGSSNVDFVAPLVLFAPLAGLAALYTAAAVNSNSALISIAVLNTGRKKREVQQGLRLPELEFLNHNHINVTQTGFEMMSRYLESTGISQRDHCLETLGCVVGSLRRAPERYQAETMAQLLDQLMMNPYLSGHAKQIIQRGEQLSGNPDSICNIKDCL